MCVNGTYQVVQPKLELFKDVENAAMQAIHGGNRTISIFTATLITVRTNNYCNFIKDFFLPTVVNHAIKIDNQVAIYFAILIASFFDIITFPVRCITLIPRVIVNAHQSAHSLRGFLVAAGINHQFLNKPNITLNLTAFFTPSLKSSNDTSNNSTKFYCGKQMRINFIEVPLYNGFRLKYDFSYVRLNSISP
jgi:hypothetical protein